MICAVIENSTGCVVATVMADPAIDRSFPGTTLIAANEPIDDRWRWTEGSGFIAPPEIVEQRRVEADRQAQIPFMPNKGTFVDAVNRIKGGDTSDAALDTLERAWGNFGYRFRNLSLLRKYARGSVVEHGSGVSTILLGLCAQRVIAVEDDPVWRQRLVCALAAAELANIIVVSQLIEAPTNADLVFVDGTTDLRARAAFLDRIGDAGTLIVDDCDAQLRRSVDKWATARSRSMEMFGSTAVVRR